MKSPLTVVIGLPGLLLLACSSTVPGGGDGGMTRVPKVHRAAAARCEQARPPGSGGGRGTCTMDAECNDATMGQNGRCVPQRIGAVCTYDTCFEDSTCGGKVCSCREAETVASGNVNHCLAAGNCRVDGDCGAGGYCSPTLGGCGHYSGVVAYYCHTSKDDCVDDSDCVQEGGLGYCAFNPASARWQCSTAECVG